MVQHKEVEENERNVATPMATRIGYGIDYTYERREGLV